MAVEASGTLIRPAPTPAMIRPGIRCVQLEVAVMPRIRNRPVATSTKPVEIIARTGRRW